MSDYVSPFRVTRPAPYPTLHLVTPSRWRPRLPRCWKKSGQISSPIVLLLQNKCLRRGRVSLRLLCRAEGKWLPRLLRPLLSHPRQQRPADGIEWTANGGRNLSQHLLLERSLFHANFLYFLCAKHCMNAQVVGAWRKSASGSSLGLQKSAWRGK